MKSTFLAQDLFIFYYETPGIGEISKTDVNPLKTKRRPLYLKTQSVPRCKHFSSRL
jgi:hypothetical protein